MTEHGGTFLRELRRRKVLRSCLYYVAACAVALFVAGEFVFPGMQRNMEPVFSAMLYSSILGLPLVAILAWYLQVTPRGIVRTTSFVERRVLRNMAPINDQRHQGDPAADERRAQPGDYRWIVAAETGPLAGLQYGITQPVELGRSLECDIAIVSQHVAPRHARLAVQDNQLLVEDLGSGSGTFVNGRVIEGRHVLVAGDELRLYDVIFRVSEKATA